MAKYHQAEDGSLKKTPGLVIYRPVLNIPQEIVDGFIDSVLEGGFTPKNVEVDLSTTSKALILGAGEIRRAQELLGVKATRAENDQLANYLNENLPDSVDEELDIPVGSVKDHIRLGNHKQLLFTVATENPVVHEERTAAQLAFESLYEVDTKSNLSHDDLWYEYPNKTDVLLVTLRGPGRNADLISPLRLLLERELEFIPPGIKEGPATIDDV